MSSEDLKKGVWGGNSSCFRRKCNQLISLQCGSNIGWTGAAQPSPACAYDIIKKLTAQTRKIQRFKYSKKCYLSIRWEVQAPILEALSTVKMDPAARTAGANASQGTYKVSHSRGGQK